MKSPRDHALDSASLMANITQVVVAAVDGGYTRDQLVALIDACWIHLAASVEQAERIDHAEEARPVQAGDGP